ncbi:MAG: GAF domain-containing protein [Anaerolineae bacterium]|jgi:GAF domain-containing protein
MSETDNRLQRMERILEISRELALAGSQEHLLQRIVDAANELIRCELAGILFLEEEGQALHLAAATRYSQEMASVPIPIDGSIAGTAFASGEPVLAHDPQSDIRYSRALEERTDFQAHSLLAVPMQFKGRRIGVLEVVNKQDGQSFDRSDIETLHLLAAEAAVAIENARLTQALKGTSDLAQALSQAGAVLRSTHSYEQVLERILEQMGRVAAYDAANIMLLEGHTVQVLHRRSCTDSETPPIPPSTSLDIGRMPGLSHMRETSQPLVIPHVEPGDSRVCAGSDCTWIRSYVGLPVLVRGEVIGFLNLYSAKPGALGSTTAQNLQAFADQTAIAIENARLFQQAQQEIEDRTRAEEELRRYRDHLEELVRERTAKLEALNLELEQEIAERKQAEEVLHRHTQRLRILHEVGQSILAASLPETIAVAAIRRIRQMIPCHRALVVATEPDGDIKMLAAESSGDTDWVTDQSVYAELLAAGPLAKGYVTGVDDLDKLSSHTPAQQTLYAAGVRSYLAVPLSIGQELVGTLNLEAAQPRLFTAEHITIATEVAASLSVAMGQARLFETAQQEIRDRRHAEAALRLYTKQLEERNAELDAFAHTVAHDLKNPIGAILGYADILVENFDTLSQERASRFLSSICRNAHRLDTIIDELLLLARVRGMHDVDTKSLKMEPIVAEARRALMPMIIEHQAELVLPRRWPQAIGYAPWVEAIWTNYMSNAIKYGGQPPRLELGATEDNDGWIRFWVRDNGPGLTPQEQARLFTPFERLHEARASGHGLGLSIVERIVSRLGGQAGVESEAIPGQGCTFYFTLPTPPG